MKIGGTLVDFFHFFSNRESLLSLDKAKEKVIHAHIARPKPDRKVLTEADAATCRIWADTLHKIGYENRISPEAVFSEKFESDIRQAFCVMQMFCGR